MTEGSCTVHLPSAVPCLSIDMPRGARRSILLWQSAQVSMDSGLETVPALLATHEARWSRLLGRSIHSRDRVADGGSFRGPADGQTRSSRAVRNGALACPKCRAFGIATYRRRRWFVAKRGAWCGRKSIARSADSIALRHSRRTGWRFWTGARNSVESISSEECSHAGRCRGCSNDRRTGASASRLKITVSCAVMAFYKHPSKSVHHEYLRPSLLRAVVARFLRGGGRLVGIGVRRIRSRAERQ